MKDALTRIGVFYDGNFFSIVSNYYAYHHPRRARISLGGLHEFIRQRVAHEEQVDARWCQVVDVHYFRGRFSAEEVEGAGRLFSERVFDDVLVREGVTTHYLPMGHAGTEKGIDVWFALEAYDLAIQKRFDVCVLVACDSDYVPLARKLNTLGTRVMVLGWDFEYTDRSERLRTTKTSQALLNEVTYPLLVSSLIEDRTQKDLVKGLFLPSAPHSPAPDPGPDPRELPSAEHLSEPNLAEPNLAEPNLAEPNLAEPRHTESAQRHSGTIQNLIEREADAKYFGFIQPDSGGDNLWFGGRDLDGVAFSALSRGDAVSFEISRNWQGPCAKRVRREPLRSTL